jgi:hypothetical protein
MAWSVGNAIYYLLQSEFSEMFFFSTTSSEKSAPGILFFGLNKPRVNRAKRAYPEESASLRDWLNWQTPSLKCG